MIKVEYRCIKNDGDISKLAHNTYAKAEKSRQDFGDPQWIGVVKIERVMPVFKLVVELKLTGCWGEWLIAHEESNEDEGYLHKKGADLKHCLVKCDKVFARYTVTEE